MFSLFIEFKTYKFTERALRVIRENVNKVPLYIVKTYFIFSLISKSICSSWTIEVFNWFSISAFLHLPLTLYEGLSLGNYQGKKFSQWFKVKAELFKKSSEQMSNTDIKSNQSRGYDSVSNLFQSSAGIVKNDIASWPPFYGTIYDFNKMHFVHACRRYYVCILYTLR